MNGTHGFPVTDTDQETPAIRKEGGIGRRGLARARLELDRRCRPAALSGQTKHAGAPAEEEDLSELVPRPVPGANDLRDQFARGPACDIDSLEGATAHER